MVYIDIDMSTRLDLHKSFGAQIDKQNAINNRFTQNNTFYRLNPFVQKFGHSYIVLTNQDLIKDPKSFKANE